MIAELLRLEKNKHYLVLRALFVVGADADEVGVTGDTGERKMDDCD